MKRKFAAVLLGAVSLTMVGGMTAQAKTYGYSWENENGSCLFYIFSPADEDDPGVIAGEFEIADDSIMAGASGRDKATVNVQDTKGADASGRDKATANVQDTEGAGAGAAGMKRISDDEDRDAWYKTEMQDILSGVKEYGVSYDEETGTIFYQGKKVRYLTDELEDGCIRAFEMPEGETDLYVIRNAENRITGVREATQEEYESRSNALLVEDAIGSSDENEAPGVVEETYIWKADVGSEEDENEASCDVEETYIWKADAEPDEQETDVPVSERIQEGTGDEKAGTYTYIEGDGMFLSPEADVNEKGIEIEAYVVKDAAGQSNEGEVVVSYAVKQDSGMDEELLQKQTEREDAYAGFGITQDEQKGCWLWNGKEIYLLMDEDGGMYLYDTEDSVKDRIYLIVKRDEQGKITEVKQVTLEEALREQVSMDAQKESGDQNGSN